MILSSIFPHRLTAELPAVHQGEKRERIEEVISYWKSGLDFNRTSSEDNLQDLLKDSSKKAKMGDGQSSDTYEFILSDTTRDDRSRFDLYFGNPASNCIFFVYGTAEHNETQIENLKRH